MWAAGRTQYSKFFKMSRCALKDLRGRRLCMRCFRTEESGRFEQRCRLPWPHSHDRFVDLYHTYEQQTASSDMFCEWDLFPVMQCMMTPREAGHRETFVAIRATDASLLVLLFGDWRTLIVFHGTFGVLISSFLGVSRGRSFCGISSIVLAGHCYGYFRAKRLHNIPATVSPH